MVRLFVLTFGFLGWAWFELSGGSEFEPGNNGLTLLAKVEAEPLPLTVTTASVSAVDVPEVTRADSGGADLATVSAASFPEQTRVVTVVPHPARPKATPVASEPVKLALAETVVKGETIVAAPVAAAEPVKIDYRTVTGNRVNLREGPGTSFGVVTQLRRGDDVEVLQDSGNGWVKLRAFDGNDIGWMSDDFLRIASN